MSEVLKKIIQKTKFRPINPSVACQRGLHDEGWTFSDGITLNVFEQSEQYYSSNFYAFLIQAAKEKKFVYIVTRNRGCVYGGFLTEEILYQHIRNNEGVNEGVNFVFIQGEYLVSTQYQSHISHGLMSISEVPLLITVRKVRNIDQVKLLIKNLKKIG